MLTALWALSWLGNLSPGLHIPSRHELTYALAGLGGQPIGQVALAPPAHEPAGHSGRRLSVNPIVVDTDPDPTFQQTRKIKCVAVDHILVLGGGGGAKKGLEEQRWRRSPSITLLHIVTFRGRLRRESWLSKRRTRRWIASYMGPTKATIGVR